MSARFFILVLVLVLCDSPLAAQPAQAPLPVLMPPIPPSPIEQFRQWLRMPASDREKSLGEYPEAKQAILRQKLQAYEAMPPDQRERRLRMLELRWYLRPLMNSAPQQRGDYLSMIPVRLHELVTTRLQQWDNLPTETRMEILASDEARELATRHFVQLRRNPVRTQDLLPLNEQQRATLQDNLKHWNQTSPSHRQKMGAHLASFFELPKSVQERTLGQLSEADRLEMQQTLDAFARLSPESRRACVNSFQKFAIMTPEERGAFLRNAARWQQMSAQERETWRRLVTMLPPMPPEPPVIPPLPRASLPPGVNLALRPEI